MWENSNCESEFAIRQDPTQLCCVGFFCLFCFVFFWFSTDRWNNSIIGWAKGLLSYSIHRTHTTETLKTQRDSPQEGNVSLRAKPSTLHYFHQRVRKRIDVKCSCASSRKSDTFVSGGQICHTGTGLHSRTKTG